jgi:hypothetical protein
MKSPTGRLNWNWHPGLQRLPSDPLTQAQAAQLRAAWRTQYPKVVAFWADMERRIP